VTPSGEPSLVVCEADIQCSAGSLFDLIVDLRGQDRWLSSSSAFHGTTDISSDPVTLGTTYREPGPLGVRNGEVTEFDPPTLVVFHQPMTMRFGLGTIDIVMRYALTPHGASTHLRREVQLGLPGRLRWASSLLVRPFRVESQRTMDALKLYADAHG
jgi:hypothetical protein